jgi:hypothetical protein
MLIFEVGPPHLRLLFTSKIVSHLSSPIRSLEHLWRPTASGIALRQELYILKQRCFVTSLCKRLMKNRTFFLCASLLALASLGAGTAAEKAPQFAVPPPVDDLLDLYCYSCHDEETQKGDIRLDQLNELTLDVRLDLLNRAQEQLFFGEMPPRKKKSQPSEAERGFLVDWISAELKQHSASKLEETLKRPEFGNYVDHDKLFSGEYEDLPGSTRDRRWLISEFIFNAKVNQLIDHPSTRTIDGEKRTVVEPPPSRGCGCGEGRGWKRKFLSAGLTNASIGDEIRAVGPDFGPSSP